jgi:hypothetical protein
VRFEYGLWGSGWAEVSIECGGQQAKFVASYLNDCLCDLARAVVNICAGSSEESVSFLDEPGEHRLLMRRIDAGNIEIEVLWYEGWVSLRPSLQPKDSVLKCTTTVAHLRGQVHSAMRRLLETLGAEGYEKIWVNNPFPMSEYERLGRAAA